MEEQKFNGKIFHLYPGEKYFTRGITKMHRVVWEYHNGKIPDGYDVHHKDENKHNNHIDNLELIERSEHMKLHGKERFINNKEWFEKFHANGIEKAKEWHKSPEGIEWHKKHGKEQGFSHYVFEDKNCPQCKINFTPQSPRHLFCSDKCAAKHRRDSGVDNETRICNNCGKEFEVNKYQKTKTCSRSCARTKYPKP